MIIHNIENWLHMQKVIARKRQIALQILDNDVPDIRQKPPKKYVKIKKNKSLGRFLYQSVMMFRP